MPALVWAAGTALAVVLSVVAINLAGAGVSDQASVTLSPARVSTALSIDAARSAPLPAAQGVVKGSPTTASSHAAIGAPTADSASSTDPTVGSGSSGQASGGHPPRAGDGGPDTSSTTQPAPVSTTTTVTPSSTRSVPSQGGTAVFQCIGSTLSLLSASPAAKFEVDTRKATEVVFVSDALTHTSQIAATCSAGTITARVKEIADS